MNKEALIERLMATFLEELEEYVQAFQRDLIALEKATETATRQDLFTTLFRTAHSLKGAARAVDLKPIAETAHQLEEILSSARRQEALLDSETLQVLFAAADSLEEASRRLRQQKNLNGSEIASVLQTPKLPATWGETPGIAGTPSAGEKKDFAPGKPGMQPAAGPLITLQVQKIDALLDRGAEVLMARRRIGHHAGAIESLQSEMSRWRSEWEEAQRVLRKMWSGGNGGQGRRNQHAIGVFADNQDKLKRFERELERIAALMAADQHRLELAAEPLESELKVLRMVPFSRATEGLDRTVRDVAQELGKELDLRIEGGEVEIDRSIVEALRSPLTQLIRNAVSHGIEPAAQRAGKSPRGRVVVSAALRGSRVEIRISDDGRGLDLAAIRDQAEAMGLEVPSSDQEAAQLIFLPGLTTAATVTGTAGRGVGLDIVKSRVQALHGSIDVSSESALGTTFTIAVPLTLTTIRALLVEVAGETFALETAGVARLAQIDREQIRAVEGREVVAVDDALLPLIRLETVLGFEGTPEIESKGRISLAVIQDGRNAVAFVVDELLVEQEVVARNLGRRVVRIRNVSGSTLLPDGRLALILNAAELIEAVRSSLRPLHRISPQAVAAGPGKKRRRLLVVDDSVTTRALQKSILESAGYEVLIASDGEEAWRLLQRELPDLIITDIEMPRMDGFALTEAIRASARSARLPVILLTALERDIDKARGIEAGADAYLIKSAFDQATLLQTISQLL